jgi:hypothetical protein
MVCASLIIVACASSTPVMAVIFGMFGACMFVMRRQMKVVLYCTAVMTVVLHFAREMPVWHLISRINVISGSTAWHRYNLIDQWINHFGQWWMLGIETTKHWGVLDITNHYVLEGIRGGLSTLAIFMAIIWLAFRAVGRVWQSQQGNTVRTAMGWALGVSLFVHCTSFLGVSYFGQIMVAWYWILAVICSMDPGPEGLKQAARAGRRRPTARSTRRIAGRRPPPGRVRVRPGLR